MRSIKNIRKIFDVDDLDVDNWYKLYHMNEFGGGAITLLFKYGFHEDGYDIMSYSYFSGEYYRGDGDAAFDFVGGKFCIMALNREVREYFPEEI